MWRRRGWSFILLAQFTTDYMRLSGLLLQSYHACCTEEAKKDAPAEQASDESATKEETPVAATTSPETTEE